MRRRRLVALRVDLDPFVGDVGPPRTPDRARASQRLGRARAHVEVQTRVGPRHEARAARVLAQVERRQLLGQLFEHPVRQAALGQRVAVQMERGQARQRIEHRRRQRAQRVARQVEARQIVQVFEVIALQRRDAPARELQRAGDPVEVTRNPRSNQ